MPTTDIVVGEFSAEQLVHIKDIELRLSNTKAGVLDNLFDLAELLSEIRANKYYRILNGGATSFEKWVDDHADLDMSARQAFFLVSINDKSKQLGISREELKAARITKLKDIFSLDTTKHAAEIKQLVKDAPDLSYEVVANRVAALKSVSGESEQYVYLTFKVPVSVKTLVHDTFERVRSQFGDSVNPETGELTELSPSRCLELVCANFFAGPDEGDEPQPLPAPF